jgi:hypothetical protein
MLVSQVGEVINSFNVVPEELFWKIIDWLKWSNDFTWLRETVGNSAWRLFANFSTGLD